MLNEDKQIADFLKEMTGGLFENLNTVKKLQGYKIYLVILTILSLFTYYQLIALAITGILYLIGLIESGFPLFMFAFVCGCIGSSFRIIYHMVVQR